MEHAGHGTPPHPHGGPGYETTDASIRGIVVFGILLVIFTAITLFAMKGVYEFFIQHGEPVATKPESPPMPTVYADLAKVRETSAETLSTYGWVDRKAGVVRIPIERALELVAQRGVPKGKGPQTEVEINARNSSAPASVVAPAPAPAPATEPAPAPAPK